MSSLLIKYMGCAITAFQTLFNEANIIGAIDGELTVISRLGDWYHFNT